MKSFEELIAEAESWRMEGWNFAPFGDRWVEHLPPWDYRERIASRLPGANSLLDLGTGGGEFLSSLSPLPERTIATEGYASNVPVARDRLRQLKVDVVQTLCDGNDKVPQLGSLPFKDSSINLVTNRHESFVASEVFRVLRPSGIFITQQVGGTDMHELSELFGFDDDLPESWNLEVAVRQLESVGFEVLDERKAEPISVFKDIGAVVMFLKITPYQVPGFSIEKYRGRLKELDGLIRVQGGLNVTESRFLVEAARP